MKARRKSLNLIKYANQGDGLPRVIAIGRQWVRTQSHCCHQLSRISVYFAVSAKGTPSS